MTMAPEDPIKLATPLPRIRPDAPELRYVSFTGYQNFFFHNAPTLDASTSVFAVPLAMSCNRGWRDAEDIARFTMSRMRSSFDYGVSLLG